jgi:hypothetical protein
MAAFGLFSTPFDVIVETVPDSFQLEITELHCSENLAHFEILHFLMSVSHFLPADKFLVLRNHVQQMTGLFRTTYL